MNQIEDEDRTPGQALQDDAAKRVRAAFAAEARLASSPFDEQKQAEAALARHLLQAAEMIALMKQAEERYEAQQRDSDTSSRPRPLFQPQTEEQRERRRQQAAMYAPTQEERAKGLSNQDVATLRQLAAKQAATAGESQAPTQQLRIPKQNPQSKGRALK
jgi:hypothetical protein